MEKYLNQINTLLTANKTTGDNHSEVMLHYSQMNVKRLERWINKGSLIPEAIEAINSIKTKQNWVVLTEAWCGDAAHSIGFMFKMASLNPLISFEWKWRDENLELMDKFLTNGGRSIPKLIVYDEKNDVLFDWGPRPKHIQIEYLEMKKKDLPYPEINIELQKLYNTDKGVGIQKEIVEKINNLN